MSFFEDCPLERLRKALKDVPYSLQLDDIHKVKRDKCKDILDRIQSEQEKKACEFERTRNSIFISILQFRLDQTEDARVNIEVVLRESTNNVTALVTKCYMEMSTGHEREAMETSAKIHTITRRDDLALVKSIADQAYYYSRISPCFYVKAINLFHEAISHNLIPDNPEQYSWKFGYALTVVRCMRLQRNVEGITTKNRIEWCILAITYLYDAPKTLDQGNLLIKCWVALGELVQLLENVQLPLTDKIVYEIRKETSRIHLTAEECFISALQIDGAQDDEFALQRCGKLLLYSRSPSRYRETLQTCYSLLKMSYDIRKTSLTCDRLAHILYKMAETKIWPDKDRIDLHSLTCSKSFPQAHGYSPKPTYHKNKSHSTYEKAHNSNRRVNRNNELPRNHSPSFNPLAPIFYPKTTHPTNVTSMTVDSLTDSMSTLEISSNATRKRKKSIKTNFQSPKSVQRFPSDHDLLNKAVAYLQESIDLTHRCNMAAFNNMGMMYRRLGQPDKAVEYFRQVWSSRHHDLFQQIKAYEQAGFCRLEMSNDAGIDREQSVKYVEESKHMMRMAIEKAAKLVANMPHLRREDIETLESYPTLKQLLGQEENMSNLRDIAHLGQLIGNHKDSLVFYEKLRKVKPKDSDVLCDLIKTYIRLKDFDNAQTAMNILLCTSDFKQVMEAKGHLVYQVYLGTAIHLLSGPTRDRDQCMIQESFLSVFDHKHRNLSREDDTQSWDVFILDDQGDSEDTTEAIQNFLQDTCGLSVTCNSDEVFAGALELSGMINIMGSSKCFIVVIGPNEFTKRMEHLVNIARNEGTPNVIVPVVSPGCTLPRILSDLSPVEVTRESLRNHENGLQLFLALLGFRRDEFEWL